MGGKGRLKYGEGRVMLILASSADKIALLCVCVCVCVCVCLCVCLCACVCALG